MSGSVKPVRSWPKSAPICLENLRAGGKPALARLLSAVESFEGHPQLISLLDEALQNPIAQVVALTGPPGVGKSTLTNTMISLYRSAGKSVGVIAVDPSSQVSGGSLLGDRTRLTTDPEDSKIFVRSMAARDRLGGLSEHAIAAVVLMRAVMDYVLVESVGIGQSEADVALVADTCVLCIQPGSGDSLQFMKAGIMELPDVICVTKADMGDVAIRAQADVRGAMSLSSRGGQSWKVPVLLLSAVDRSGIAHLIETCSEHFSMLCDRGQLHSQREQQVKAWLSDQLKMQFGSHGVQVLQRLDVPWGEAVLQPFAFKQKIASRFQGFWSNFPLA
ncbi:ATP/GTP-binding protein [Pseudovibrio sp. Tun.PSC04-5.I4]|uniref:ArgK/MeaB family GTPase n=1 Tax=Pseudovibrio sp. Tun.PSC04-5.I4 TaxID=1798213 RepID=UPI0008845591|nr:ATP/GTP-binding protein [Pseudovibrio sp. Tun.PSC04-5.I4]SDR37772.1 LAO/AO transport system kinase [Pseudovibrio sp. Tun.PSC04-5.I4]